MTEEMSLFERRLVASGREEERNRILKVLECTFTEGWWHYFNTTYGVDDTNVNEEMLGDIDRKITQLKNGIMSSHTVQKASPDV